MSTPRKNYNSYKSPYSKPVQPYASQNDDYISLEMGGRCHEGREVNGGVNYTKRTNQRRTHCYGGHNENSQFKSGSGQKSWCTRKNEGGNSGSYRISNFKQSPNLSVSSYIHPSMTEDPWSDLMARIESLEKSVITLKVQTDDVETGFNGGVDSQTVESLPT
ncbi:uncharacterized protein LOC133331875 [Musca vetustissima]|uniref:uncharacterized protein LOC133331875 n=1 Tax=Musca vetustissima TaxID=27455 RepID=UPI002AB63B71|nr:uncharacterized protein LOC133331875 [Musca vetustissima]